MAIRLERSAEIGSRVEIRSREGLAFDAVMRWLRGLGRPSHGVTYVEAILLVLKGE